MVAVFPLEKSDCKCIYLFLSWDVETSKSKGSDFGSPREVFFDFLTSKIKQPISRLQGYEIPVWKKKAHCIRRVPLEK